MNRIKLAAAKKRIETDIESMKRAIAVDIAAVIEDRQLTQTEAAYQMQDAPSQISLVVTGKLRGFSIERLLRMRALLGAVIALVIEPSGVPQVKPKLERA